MTSSRHRRGVPLAVLAPVAATVAHEPRLWTTGLRTLVRLAPRRWWGRAPYLPVPDAAWWAFRMETAYGSPDAVPASEDVLSFLRWCRATARPPESRSSRPRRRPPEATSGRRAAS
ncbi:MAG: hypothetical protein M0040_00510 [Actinomycetota bacterium]|nr:hypothetical protein [Actinomycetota bacterium]